jgi:nickel-dependent lactate racemase
MNFSGIELKYGTTRVKVSMASENLLGILEPGNHVVLPHRAHAPRSHAVPGAAHFALTNEDAEIQRALANPIGSRRLEDLVSPGMKVTIIASDATRPCPTATLLPPLIKRLSNAGIRDQDITIVFAMGIHRNHSEPEKRRLVGSEVYQRYKCVDSSEGQDYVYLGTTSYGTPVEIARVVVEADFLVCTGNIEYHYFAGYSGGTKAALPGCASRASVEANHAMQLWPGAESGSYDDNPVRNDIEEAGKMVGIDFILNVVLDEEKRIVKAVAGNPVEAHAAGRQVVDAIYGVTISQRSDIVLASCGGHPKDLNLYQAQKAIENASRAVKPGGAIILLAECPEGIGESVFESYITGMDLDHILSSIAEKFVLGGHKAAAIARVLKKCSVTLVTCMNRDLVESCKLFWAPSAQEALSKAFGELGKCATIWVMPYAGSTVPLPG